MMDNSLLNLLRRVDTPTVCNAIEVAQGKRGFADFTRATVLSSAPNEPAMVGYACTAKIAALAPPHENPATLRERRMAYYRYMAEAPCPAVTIIEDVDFPNCVGAYWGEINTNIHKGFGISGALTNGVMRDLGDLPKGFPVVAGSVGPSHAFAHVTELDTPVTVFGLTIRPADLVHADRHGAVVIPQAVIDHLQAAILKLMENEQKVLEATRRADFDFNVFQAAWTAFEKKRT